ncbi:MAG: hypothetical protein Fur0042_11790 [Cyanophyceae cyanobacterium]
MTVTSNQPSPNIAWVSYGLWAGRGQPPGASIHPLGADTGARFKSYPVEGGNGRGPVTEGGLTSDRGVRRAPI